MNFYQKLYNYTNNINDVYQVDKEFGGCNLYIPKKISAKHFLSNYSEDFKSFLIQNYAGKTIYVPLFKPEHLDNNQPSGDSILHKIKLLIMKSLKYKK